MFDGNIALENGGAINYNSYAPTLINNTFMNNEAIFAPDLASYAVEIKQKVGGQLVKIEELKGVPSGLVVENPISLVVVDAEGKIMTTDSKSYIKIVELTKGTEIKGQDIITLTNGEATFEGTIFYAQPGSENVKFRIVSNAINYEMVQAVTNFGDQDLTVSFRWCRPGEIQIGDICSPCNAGSYSVKWNETVCNNCPDYASCEAEMISLNKGYWRLNGNSTDIIECPNEEACLGGYSPHNENPVDCANGYRGYL